MNLRLMGSSDLVIRFARMLEGLGIPGRIYPQRDSAGSRLYIEVDDRVAADLAQRLEAQRPQQPGKGRRVP